MNESWAYFILFLLSLAVFARFYLTCYPTLHFHKQPAKIPFQSPISNKIHEISIKEIVENSCSSMQKFVAHPLLPFGHLQTFYASVFAEYLHRPTVSFWRELVKTTDGGVVSLDWTIDPKTIFKSTTSKTPYVFICHGLTGGSHETYIQDLVRYVRSEFKYECLVMNFRGCSGSPIHTPQLYSGSFTDDVDVCLDHILKTDPNAVLFGVGYSLGSNVITKYTGQKGENCPLIGMVSVGNPYDFLGSIRALHRSWIGRNLYSKHLAKSLINLFQKHHDVFRNAEWLDMEKIKNGKTVEEFDAHATCKQFGYATVHEYYRFGSSSQDIPYISIPCLFLTALDDPISNQECIPYLEIASNPNAVLVITRLGGHLGWFEAGWKDFFIPKDRWAAKPVGQFLHAIIEAHLSLPDHLSKRKLVQGRHTGTPWHSLPIPAMEARHKLIQQEEQRIKQEKEKSFPDVPLVKSDSVPAITITTGTATSPVVMKSVAVESTNKIDQVHAETSTISTIPSKSIKKRFVFSRKWFVLVVTAMFLYFDRRIKASVIIAFLMGALFTKK